MSVRQHDVRDTLHGFRLVGDERRVASEKWVDQHSLAAEIETKG
jgi:hypothetical protein